MRVLCFDKKLPVNKNKDLLDAYNKIKTGSVYNVVWENEKWYELLEFPHPFQIQWEKSCFIPLSEIDETEFVNQKELVNFK